MLYNPTVLNVTKSALAECPVWDEKNRTLYWIDILGKTFHSLQVEPHKLSSIKLKSFVGSFTLTTDNRFVLASNDGIKIGSLFEKMNLIKIPEFDNKKCQINDGKCDRQGNFLFGLMARNERAPLGSLYRLNKDMCIEKLLSGITIWNGPAFSLDGKTLYFSDTFNKIIYRCDYDANSNLQDRGELFYKFSKLEGAPDGITVDSQDTLWVACWGGKRVIAIDKMGQKVLEIPLPTSNITSCVFGGPSYDTLYITSAKKNLKIYEKNAGSIFQVKTDTTGLPPNRFSI